MLQKGFLRNKNQLIISQKRFWISVVVGFLVSFSIYSLFCLFRFIFRTIDFGYANWALIIEPNDRYWQNFIFALIALVIGNSIFIIGLFSKPIKGNIKETKRSAILNNQYFLPFNYFHLLTKFIFLIMLMPLTSGEFNLFLNPFKKIIFLVIIVLFLESWKGIIRLFRISSYKYIILNALIIILLAFSFSFTSVINYKNYDKEYQTLNPFINLPTSSFVNKKSLIYYHEKIKIWKFNGKIKYTLNGQKVNNTNELLELFEARFHPNRRSRRRLGVLILAPNDIQFVEIKKIEKLLFSLNIIRVKYIVKENDGDNNRYSTRGIQKILLFKDIAINNFRSNNHLKTRGAVPPPPIPLVYFKNKNTVDVKIEDKFYFNDKIVPKKILVNYFKNNITDSTVFHYHFNNSISYQKYITLFSAHKEAIDYLRSRDQLVKPKGNFYFPENKEEYEKDQWRLKRKYPLMYLDNNDVTDFE